MPTRNEARPPEPEYWPVEIRFDAVEMRQLTHLRSELSNADSTDATTCVTGLNLAWAIVGYITGSHNGAELNNAITGFLNR